MENDPITQIHILIRTPPMVASQIFLLGVGIQSLEHLQRRFRKISLSNGKGGANFSVDNC